MNLLYYVNISDFNKVEKVSTDKIIEALKRKLKRNDFDLLPVNKYIDVKIEDINKVDKAIKEINYNKLKSIVVDVTTSDDYSFKLNVAFCAIILKSKSKMLGLKSVFVRENELVLTSFAKNDDTIKEKLIKNNDINEVDSLVNPETYSVKDVSSTVITIEKKGIKGEIKNPSKSAIYKDNMVIKRDYLDRKDIIENRFFGRVFDDNIHVQLGYRILDFNKTLGIYIAEAQYAMEGLTRNYEKDKLYDFVGTTKYGEAVNNKDSFKNWYQKAKPFLKYFAGAYSTDSWNLAKQDKNSNNDKETRKDNLEEKKKNETYLILRILSMCRQFSMHGYTDLYNLKKTDDNKDIHDLIDYIDNKFKDSYNKLLDGTIKNSSTNIAIIMSMLGLDLNNYDYKAQILNEYFDYTVKKSNKNLGFNFIALKEALLNELDITVDDDKKQSTFQAINFVIYKKLMDNGYIIEKYVGKLLATAYDMDKKAIYSEFAKEIKPLFSNIDIKTWIDYEKDDKRFKDFVLSKEMIDNRDVEDDTFVSLVYFLTYFLDSKEINMFVTDLINKFNSINGFINVLDGKPDFKDEYAFFLKSKEYAEKLNVVLTLARMQKNFKKKNTKDKQNTPDTSMIYDAYCLFGYDKPISDFDKDTDNDSKSNGKKGKFKNKIISTIVNANKFRYIIKYANPKDCRKIMQNEKVIAFVLKEIPQTQIDKYLNGRYQGNNNDRIGLLAKEIKDLSINQMKDNYNSGAPDAMDLPKLYMTVIYQIVKQIVRINAVYNVAFGCFERDRELFGIIDYKDNSDLTLVELFAYGNREFDFPKKHITLDKVVKKYKKRDGTIAEGAKLGVKRFDWIRHDAETFKDLFYTVKPENPRYIKKNELEQCNTIYRDAYRNKIVHLNAISDLGKYLNDFSVNREMKSYFELYQYIMQRVFIQRYEDMIGVNNLPSEFIRLKDEVLKYHTYSRDLLHILNMPLAYNVARYKNLTIEDIFYDRYKNEIKIIKDEI